MQDETKTDKNSKTVKLVDDDSAAAKNLAKADKAAKKKNKKNKKKASYAPRKFPKYTLEEALIIAKKIKEHNAGNPWSPLEIAKAYNLSIKNIKFYYLAASSRDYGLTTGSKDSEKIALTELGKDIVYAPNIETINKKKLEAFRNIETFQKVLNYYKGANLPDMEFLGNTLEREFQIAPKDHEEFAQLFKKNCYNLGIKEGIGSNGFDKIPVRKDDTVVTFGEPSNSDSNLKAFVIMPFTEGDRRPEGFYQEVLKSLTTRAGVAAGFIVETAKIQGSDLIHSTIINQLLEADLVIADLTDHNPNVLFELGVRMAIDKPVVLIKSSDTGRIFDIDNMLRVFEYNPNLWNSTIENDLPNMIEHIKATWQNKNSEQTYMRILKKHVAVPTMQGLS